MKKVLNGKAALAGLLLAWVLIVHFLTGCSGGQEEKVRDLEFTVMSENELPEELKQMVQEKQTAPFKLTYSDDQNLYIAVGYGEQTGGGYSIAVKSLYLTDNSIVYNTELLGPENGEEAGEEKSYPYIVVRTEFLEEPVIFE